MDRGSQSMEFAMVLPLAAILMVVIVGLGVVIAATVQTHVLSSALARRAAVVGDTAVVAQPVDGITVLIEPPTGHRLPGDVVTVVVVRTVTLPLPGRLGLDISASASALTEAVP